MRTFLASLFVFALLACIALLPGCAGYEIQPIAQPADWSKAPEGYVIYEPEPLLRVTVQAVADGKRTVESAIVYLPNKKRPYRVTTYSWLASADIKLDYQDGWMLTGVQSKVDTTAVAKALIDAAKAAATGRQGPAAELEPGIYYFRITEDWGLERVLDVKGK